MCTCDKRRLHFAVGMYDCGDIKETHPSSTSAERPKKPIIICGDFNVAATPLDLANPKANEGNAGYSPQEREKFHQLKEAGFIDTYRHLHPDEQKYSWWSYRFKSRERNIGWRLDYFLTNGLDPERIKRADILTDIHGSDHCPIVLEIDA